MLTLLLTRGPYKPRTGHTSQCMNHAPAILVYWPHWPYTLVYMAVLYTKQGTVKLLKMLMKSTQRRIGCHFKHASVVELLKLLIRYNKTVIPVDYKGDKNSSGDEIANVNFFTRHHTCRGQPLCPLNGLPNFYYK